MRRFKERPKRQKLISLSVVMALTFIAVVGAVSVAKLKSNLNDQQVRAKSYQTQLKKLDTELDKAKTEVKQDKTDNSAAQQQIQQLQKDKTDLQQQLQAKAEEKSKLAQIADTVRSVVSPVAYADGCGDNQYSSYIYSHESGCSTNITNSEGCIGIGQACPASKLIAACPSLDYACENTFFTNYAVAKYGSWEGAYNAWLAQHWW